MASIIWKGTTGNDAKYGGADSDRLSGLAGNDTLYGLNGSDTLVGDAGDDVIYGGDADGNDTALNRLYGSAGSDRLYGGSASDFLYPEQRDAYSSPVEYSANYVDGGAGTDTVFIVWRNRLANGNVASVSLDFGDGNFTVKAGGRDWDVLTRVEKLNYKGTDAGDVITGGSRADYLELGTGNDVVRGKGGDDTIFETGGVLDIDGGSGVDFLLIWPSEQDDQPRIAIMHDDGSIELGGALAGSVKGIERLNANGTEFADRFVGGDYADSFYGNDGNDYINSLGGDDSVNGGNGNDRLASGNGSDVVRAGAGNDVISSGTGASDYLYGDAGSDTVTYAGSTRSVIASLVDQSINTHDAQGDIYGSIENLVGSKFDDRLYGDSGNNALSGGAGADRLFGGEGDDLLTGGVGADRYYFDTGFIGSSNIDTISTFSSIDEILLASSIFEAAGTVGTLASAAFASNNTGLASDASDRIIYEKDTGKLYYDYNGSKFGGGQIFAIVDKNLSLSNSDFVIF